MKKEMKNYLWIWWPTHFQQPKQFEGQVVFVMGKRTFSSAGMLFTMTRDNYIGTIIGTTSTFRPSHYGEVLPYRLPNTGVLGSISCKFFARPDALWWMTKAWSRTSISTSTTRLLHGDILLRIMETNRIILRLWRDRYVLQTRK